MKLVYIKYFLVLSLCVGFSTSLFSQEFANRRLGAYIAKTYSNLHVQNDTVFLFGRGTLESPPYSARLNVTKCFINGNIISDSTYFLDPDTNYLPWLQGSTKRDNHQIYVSGSGGNAPNTTNKKAWLAKYDVSRDSLHWFYEVEPVLKSNNSIITETVLLPSGHIMGVMIESIDTIPQQFFIRLLKWNESGDLLFEKQIKDIGLRYVATSLLLNQNNELIIGLQRTEIDTSSRIQLWKLDTLGNILDVYDSGSTNNEDKECNKIIQSADGGYIFLDRVIESNPGLPMYSSRITKLSNTFEKVWEKKVGNIEFRTELYNVKQTNDGNYITVGISAEENENGVTPAHLVKFNENGTIIWESLIDIDISSDENPNAYTRNYLYDIVELDEGGFIACGQSLGQFVDSFPQQALLIRVDDKGQLNHIFFTPLPDTEPLVVYPNPVSSFLHLKTEVKPYGDYDIITIHGQVLLTGNYEKEQGVDVSSLAAGIYVIRLDDGRMASFIKK